MPQFIILLRGINVGGKNKLPMKDLSAHMLKAGFTSVKTYIQSGNIVATADMHDKQDVADKVTQVIGQNFGFPIKALVLTIADYAAALAANPFQEAEENPSTLHLYFMDSKPNAPDMDKLTHLKTGTERFHIEETTFYLHAPDGIGRSKLAAGAEKALGVPATARNWRSAIKILELAGQD